MTTIAPSTTPTTELDDIYPDLAKLVYGVAIQNLDAGSVPAGFESHLPTAGRANLRAKGGETSTTKKAKVDVLAEPIVGATTYTRPNGREYYARQWGEHSDVEVCRKARDNKQFILL